jgi:purine-binding chemotaxis protein CheW
MRTESDVTAQAAQDESALGAQLAGKYMTFQLASEVYGLEILKVREIIGVLDITRVPRAAPSIRGVINLRGKVIPVVDLRLKFGMPRTEPTEQTVIIVVQYDIGGVAFTMGILVDQVLEVASIEAGQIEPPPSFGSDAVDTEFITGVAKAADAVVFLLDIGKVLTTEESRALSQATA